ncbi:MAG: rubrerythrin [Candidatus Brocadiia bacterium]|nr:MAG: rubrerythrin [Candidatus Brocadiia bacterium]
MAVNSTFVRIMNFAIAKEAEAYDFYTNLADSVKKPDIKETILDFAEQELEHKEALESLKAGGDWPESEQAGSIDLADYIVNLTYDPDMTYLNALAVAIKKEDAANRLYRELARLTDNIAFKNVFNLLAQQEARHRLRFELEYDLESF